MLPLSGERLKALGYGLNAVACRNVVRQLDVSLCTLYNVLLDTWLGMVPCLS